MTNDSRRPVSSRSSQVFHDLAHKLVKWGLTPNQISVCSSVFALIAGFGFWWAGHTPAPMTAALALLIALGGIQGRLICNLIDGLMAVEGGLKTKAGDLFNEVPDRVSDTVIFLGAAFSVPSETVKAIGLAAALAAVATAYVRVLGASVGAPHYFVGPMAKQHRMFLMNVCAIACLVEKFEGSWGWSIGVALAIIAVGSLITCWTRLRLITKSLNSK